MNTGSRLGPYEILEQLGAGGMGEVWLAQDTRLGRRVAVKVLPAEFAADPERLARFEQEARASAALNHPNIAAVFDVGHEAGDDGTTTHYMVQEYLQGHTLRSVLDAGALKLERALDLGVEMAEALRAAHRAGIVHRDLKPDNVFVTEDGHAKVLDFGLAKLTETATPAVGSQSMSPTVLGTQAGAIMGTAGYMAPEQAQGEEVDHRADLFAFGCVLYEMATGRQPFAGKNVYDTIGRIVSDEPAAVSEIDPSLPAQLQWIVRKCLAKEPGRRYQGAGDLAVDLAALAADAKAGLATAGAGANDSIEPTAATATNAGLLAAVAAAALIAGSLGAWALLRPGPSEPEPVRRFALPVPESWRLPNSTHPLAISPDGRNVVMLAIDGSDRWLDLRRIDQLEAHEIPGTRGVQGYPFFSPDSRGIGFSMGDRIVRASLAGEPPQTVATTNVFRGATWTDADEIVYSDDGALFVVPAAGGTSRPVPVMEDDADTELRFPSALPGGREVLATAGRNGDGSTVIVDLETGRTRPVIDAGTGARYVGGTVAYGRDGFLFAVPFDPDSGSATGEPVPMVEGVQSGTNGAVHFDVSSDGTLVYSPANGGGGRAVLRLALIDRTGQESPLPIPAGLYWDARLSPDGRRALVAEGAQDQRDLYVYDLARGAGQRLTSDAGNDRNAVWWPDGESVVYGAEREGIMELYRQSADTLDGAERLLENPGTEWPGDVDREGRRIALVTVDSAADLAIFHVDDERLETVLATDFAEFAPRFSPDGRWLAYVSNESGRPRVYVLDLESGRRVPASARPAFSAEWAPDGSRIYFADDDEVLEAPVRVTGDRLEVAAATPFYRNDGLFGIGGVTPDGEQLLVVIRGEEVNDADQEPRRFEVVLNWFEDVAQRRGERQE